LFLVITRDSVCYSAYMLSSVTVGVWYSYIKHPVPDRVKPSFVIFDIRALTLSPECQSAQMSKLKNYK